MRKYLVFSLIVFVLSFGCNTSGSKNSDGTANGDNCPVCDVCPVCPNGTNPDGTCRACDTYTPIAAPVISKVYVGTTSYDIYAYNGSQGVGYTVNVITDKQVTHSMNSADGKAKGIFVARLKDTGGLEPVAMHPSSQWWSNLLGEGNGFQWISSTGTDFPAGHYIVTVVLGDEEVTVFTGMFYKI